MTESQEDLVTVLLSLLYSRFTIMSTLVVATLEYFQLFDAEKKYMWSTQWQPAKILFFGSRYLPFVYMPLFMFTSFAQGDYSPENCRNVFALATAILIFSILVADAVLYLRLYALSKNDRIARLVLVSNYIGVSIGCIVGIALFLKAQNWITPPTMAGPISCFGLVGKATRFGATLCYGALLWSSMFTMSLSVWYGVRMYLAIRPMPLTGLVKIFYQDGILYFVIIGLLSLTNAFMSLSQGPRTYYAYILATPQAASHSIVVARMLLHLRGVADDELKGTVRSSRGSLEPALAFASRPRPPGSYVLSSNSHEIKERQRKHPT
ncbi:hypothetical protein BKA70DRAFT_70597 [Coprinopsis sp. MPI-PUGE-AT-0042]|nr:hypothetical protein BKA70DRAFT_70597 [Coprinopsis sp. MPI-PUGE-AT-0042]